MLGTSSNNMKNGGSMAPRAPSSADTLAKNMRGFFSVILLSFPFLFLDQNVVLYNFWLHMSVASYASWLKVLLGLVHKHRFLLV
ncbi:hypothetical protein GQ55_2G221300 [Panicum hallii var. hallii]|uniref:Uncharacterized protein n=1 Tax=Panicum hallii var. hallii TaxID=1504633 RepID=A0A2T7ERA6_9POAL|nr:hypothetical protein GQ55_2G221300 [Panicum hallii var. hallii]